MTALVLLHGWGASGEVWQKQVEPFQDRVTVLAPTIPSWDVEWFIEYLQTLPLQNCVLVGWSLGGMLLLEALTGGMSPRPGGLVLAGVAPVFCRRPDYPWGQPPALVRAMRRAVKDHPRQVLEEFAGRCLAPGEAADSDQVQAAFSNPAPDGILAAGLDYLLTRDLRPRLAAAPENAFIIQGQEDAIVDPAQGRFLRKHLRNASLYDLPGAGHVPFLTQAAAFNGIIEACLNSVS
jgi:pimeloyl-[acyl-carrier protein] methyl ester esterase